MALVSACSSDDAPTARPTPPTRATPVPGELPAGDDATVERVVDGDTIVTSRGTVRLIGIDTPESVHPTQPVECLGREAAEYTKVLLPAGTRVRLVYDVDRTDRYERLLAYVYRSDDRVFVNAELAAAGYADVLTVPPNVAHTDDFIALVREAREANRGLWQACEVSSPTTAPALPGECDLNYRGACVPPYPPDVDCADIGVRVEIAGDDPHHLDGNGDGTGCEGASP